MEDNLHIIWLLALCLGGACIAGYLARMCRLSPILGFLVAGYLIGPNSPGLIVDQWITDQLANVGLTLLMFAVGLNFKWKDIGATNNVLLPGAVLLSMISIAAGLLVTVWLGGTAIEGFVIGVAVCVSSTVVMVRILADQNLLHTKQGHIVVGWTLIEDLISIMGLVLLPALVSSSEGSLLYSIALVLLKIAALGLIVYFVGEKLIEYLLVLIARTRSHELFTLAILSVVFFIAVGSAYVFGVSLALGAFIAGMVVGKTELSHQAAANALPMRDAFAVIFFLAVGMLFNPLAVGANIPLFIGILAIVLLVRPVSAFLIMKAVRYPNYMAFAVAMAIAQIGEYSFILAEEGSRLQILPDSAYDILVACAFISIGLNSVLFQVGRHWIDPRRAAKSEALPEETAASGPLPSFLPRAVVVGFGPVGRAVVQYLAQRANVLVIDQNIDTVTASKTAGIEILYGDAKQMHLLEQARIEDAQLVVITTPDVGDTLSIIMAVQQINPLAEIIARVHFQGELERFKLTDIPVICDEEAAGEQIITAIKNRSILAAS